MWFPAGGARVTIQYRGLGLSICQRVVAEVGGKIWLDESGTLGGARFVVELPAAPVRDEVIG